MRTTVIGRMAATTAAPPSRSQEGRLSPGAHPGGPFTPDQFDEIGVSYGTPGLLDHAAWRRTREHDTRRRASAHLNDLLPG